MQEVALKTKKNISQISENENKPVKKLEIDGAESTICGNQVEDLPLEDSSLISVNFIQVFLLHTKQHCRINEPENTCW